MLVRLKSLLKKPYSLLNIWFLTLSYKYVVSQQVMSSLAWVMDVIGVGCSCLVIISSGGWSLFKGGFFGHLLVGDDVDGKYFSNYTFRVSWSFLKTIYSHKFKLFWPLLSFFDAMMKEKNCSITFIMFHDLFSSTYIPYSRHY